MTDRKLTIQPKYRRLTYSEKDVPEIRFSGIWLEKSGFKIGEQVQVIIKDHEITLKPL